MGTASDVFLLCYTSLPSPQVAAPEIDAIVASSRRNNAHGGVTGWLAYSANAFAQLIEGPEQNVLALYEKLTRDPRHSNLVLVLVDGDRQYRCTTSPMEVVEVKELADVRRLIPRSFPTEVATILEVAF